MAIILQTAFSNAFSLKKCFVFIFKFHGFQTTNSRCVPLPSRPQWRRARDNSSANQNVVSVLDEFEVSTVAEGSNNTPVNTASGNGLVPIMRQANI